MRAESSKGLETAVIVVSVVLTIVFLGAGAAKLAGADTYVQTFAGWGYPQWSRLLIGALEILFAIALWIPRARAIGGIGLSILMLGAIVSYARHDAGQSIGISLLLLILSAFVAWARRYELGATARRSAPRPL